MHLNKKVFLLLTICFTIAGCRKEKDPSTFSAYSTLYDEPDDPLDKALHRWLDSLEIPQPVHTFVLDSSWTFLKGDPAEGMSTEMNPVTRGEVVYLPHRILAPDTPLWYKTSMFFPEAGFLFIRADDGAQLFINGVRVKRYHDNIFPVERTGQLTITIRVLNNAMQGGLNSVSYLTIQEFRNYERQLSAYRENLSLVHKLLLLRDSNLKNNLVDLLCSNEEQARTDVADEMADYPYFTGPFIQRGDDGTIFVNVEMERTCEVTMTWGETETQLENKITRTGRLISFELPKLEKDHRYFYRLSSERSGSEVFSFETERTGEDFSFNVWGDSQSGWNAFHGNVQNLKKYNDAFGVAVGDIVSNGSDSAHWKTFLNILSMSGSKTPYYLVAGNHDYDGYYDDLIPRWHRHYTEYNPSNYFMWTYGNAAFIALDPNTSFPIGTDSLQRKWFREQVQSERWKKATWRFVFLHQTLYSEGWSGYEGDLVLREWLEPYMESAKIDFVVSGHTHDYERLTKNYGNQKVTFLVVGGGGGSLEPDDSQKLSLMDTIIKRHHIGRFHIQLEKVRFEAIDLNNRVMDSLTIEKGGRAILAQD